MEGYPVRKTTSFLFYMKMFQVRTPGKLNSLYSPRYIVIDYYKHINKSEFNAQDIHDVALKVDIIRPHGETTH